MALRALGYGNVADFEGTWPTAYMLKAVELDLTRDMEGVKADAASLRGNIAILLWNMLRTPMWRVTEESENSGMTLSNANKQRMLNVKFPDYTYVEDVYVDDITVTDCEDVLLGLSDIIDNKAQDIGAAQISGVDITRLVRGEKVTALVKQGKKGEDPTYLTVTPVNNLVEGVVTKVDNDRFTVDGTEYRMDPEKGEAPVKVADLLNQYVLFEVDGKKVNTFDGEYIIKVLPVGGTEVEDVKAALRKIKEDSLVIKDGEWIDREDIEEGDVYTEMKDWNGKSYWQIAGVDTRIEGSFDSYTTKNAGKDNETNLIKVDGEELLILKGYEFEAKEGEKNDKTVTKKQLQEKDNKYLDQEVEVLVDYLGNPIKALFGEVEENGSDGSFYTVVNGTWKESGKKGSNMISLVGFDGEGASKDEASEGKDYSFKNASAMPNNLTEKDLLDGEVPVFAWVKFDSDNETIKDMITFKSGEVLASGDGDFRNKYTILPLTSGDVVKDGKIKYESDDELSGDYRITNAQVMVVTPLKDEDEKVEGFSVEIKTGLENDDKIPGGSFMAVDASKKVKKAAFVFLAEDAESTEWLFGVVTDYDNKNESAKEKIEIDGEEYEFDVDDSPIKKSGFGEDDVIAYTIYKDKVKVQDVFTPDMLDEEVKLIDEETEADTMVFTDGTQLDLDEDSDDQKDYKNYKVVEVSVTTSDSDDTELVFDSVTEREKGLSAITNSVGIRVFFSDNKDHHYILVFKGLTDKDKAIKGYLKDEGSESESETPASTTGNVMKSGDYRVIAEVKESATERFAQKAEGEICEAVERELQSTFSGIVLNTFETPYTLETEVDLETAPTVAAKCQIDYDLTGDVLTVIIK